mgnify:CR=1 FL=1
MKKRFLMPEPIGIPPFWSGGWRKKLSRLAAGVVFSLWQRKVESAEQEAPVSVGAPADRDL